jgi:hypothetical protein
MQRLSVINFKPNSATSQMKGTVGWWTPWVESTATVYQPRDFNATTNWCVPKFSPLNAPPVPRNIRDPVQGLLYIKSHKVASSTLSGVNNAIAHHVATRLRNGHDELSCEHYDRHVFHDHKEYIKRRDVSRSLLWSFVRSPSSRDISAVYHFLITRQQLDPLEHADEILNILRTQYRGAQAAYLVMRLQDLVPLKRATTTDLAQLSEFVRTKILEKYDFIGIVERMTESLAVMTLLWNLDPTDVIVLSSKTATGDTYDDGQYQKSCAKLIPPPRELSELPLPLATYIQSDEYIQDNIDYLLYYAANESLDRTIQGLGPQIVAERAALIRELQGLANRECQSEAIFPCSDDGVLQLEASRTNCYIGDAGCGYECIDRVMKEHRETAAVAAVPNSNKKNITISVFINGPATNIKWTQSFFVTDQLSKYGEYSYQYEWLDFKAKSVTLKRMAMNSSYCILAGRSSDLYEIRDRHAPQCYVIQFGTEQCHEPSDGSSPSSYSQGRFYYHERAGGATTYLPLGPRWDFWKAYQAASSSSTTRTMIPASQRPYLYNAIFSKSTNPTRQVLAEYLSDPTTSTTGRLNATTVINIADTWSLEVDSQTMIQPPDYLEILSQSTFTLSPAGHNPECFRLYEAAIMGSIPVVALDESYTNHSCPNAFVPFYEYNDDDNNKNGTLPFVVLDNWTMLDSTLDRMFYRLPNGDLASANQTATLLDAFQRRLIAWYEPMMIRHIRAFEDRFMTFVALQQKDPSDSSL